MAEAFYGPDLAVATFLPRICHWPEDSHIATPNHGEARKCSPAVFERKGNRFGEHVTASVTIPNLDATYRMSLISISY